MPYLIGETVIFVDEAQIPMGRYFDTFCRIDLPKDTTLPAILARSYSGVERPKMIIVVSGTDF